MHSPLSKNGIYNLVPSQVSLDNTISAFKKLKLRAAVEDTRCNIVYDTTNFQDLGKFVIINCEYLEKEDCKYVNFIFETDVREAKSYKVYKNKSYRFIVGIFRNKANKFMSDDDMMKLKVEKSLMKKIIKLKSNNQVIRLSGNYLEKTKIFNGAVALLGSRSYILKLRDLFNPTDKENFIGILNVPVDRIFRKEPVKYIISNFKNDDEYSKLNLKKKDIVIKHHLMYFIRRLNILYQILKTKKYKRSNPLYLLLLVKKGINKYYIDIPGGKREIGESSMEAAEREFFEETGISESAFGKGIFLSEENKKIEIDKMDIFLKINQKSEFSEVTES